MRLNGHGHKERSQATQKNSQGICQEAGGEADIGQGSVDTVFFIVQVLHNLKNDLLYNLHFALLYLWTGSLRKPKACGGKSEKKQPWL